MQSTGMIRKVYDRNVISLPSGLCETIGVKVGDKVEIMIEGNDILGIRKYADRCVICDGKNLGTSIGNKPICIRCITQIKKMGGS